MNATVDQVMTHQVVTVGPATPIKQVAEILHGSHITAVPVVDDGWLVGIVSEEDLLDRHGEDAEAVMTAKVKTIRSNASIAEAQKLMHRLRVRRLPVVDASGKLVGIVSRADLIKPLVRSDAEIQEEINDKVLRDTLWVDPQEVRVTVRDGVVTLQGRVESKSLRRILVRSIEGVTGVIEVRDWLVDRLDDSHLKIEPPPGAEQFRADERRG